MNVSSTEIQTKGDYTQGVAPFPTPSGVAKPGPARAWALPMSDNALPIRDPTATVQTHINASPRGSICIRTQSYGCGSKVNVLPRDLSCEMASKRQLTLFQCGKTRTNKRAKITEPELNETPSPSDGDESDSNESDGLRETGTRTNSSQQTNNIQIDKPVGATTIIINAASADSEKTLESRSATNSQAPQSGQPSDLASLGAPPSRPVVDFPPTVFSGKKRSFNPKWYEEFEWLEYSISRDAAFCYPCRVFTTGSGKAEGTFTVTGFRDWKHASGNSGVLHNHDKCSVHRNAVIAWGQYRYGVAYGKSVADQLHTSRTLQIEKNRHYLKDVILLCALQEITLRGHDKSSEYL